MVLNRITDHLTVINQQVKTQEALFENLSKAEALANVALGEDFLNCKTSIIHAHLWALCGIIEEAKNLNEQTLNTAYKVQQSLTKPIRGSNGF